MPCLLVKDLPKMHAVAKDAGFKSKMHRFPSNPATQNRWYAAIDRFLTKGHRRPQQDRLCSLHFKPSDFIRTDLIEGSIPSVFTPRNTTDLWMLHRKRFYARCCVPGCQTVAHFNLYPFVPEHDTADSGLARRRFRLWVRTLQVVPCRARPEVWICRRHFVSGFPADLKDRFNVDWVPTLNLEGIARNPCRECSIVLQKLPNCLDAPFCRLCLRQNVPLQALCLNSSEGQKLAELIERLATIKIELRQESICIDCLDQLAQMEKMEQVRARWNANNSLLERLRGSYNNPESAFKDDPRIHELPSLSVVSIPLDTLMNSIYDQPPKEEESVPLANKDYKQDLEQHALANITQDCIVVDPPPVEVIDLTDIDERELLIRLAMRVVRRQLKHGKPKRKRSKTLDQQPAPWKLCRNTRIG